MATLFTVMKMVKDIYSKIRNIDIPFVEDEAISRSENFHPFCCHLNLLKDLLAQLSNLTTLRIRSQILPSASLMALQDGLASSVVGASSKH